MPLTLDEYFNKQKNPLDILSTTPIQPDVLATGEKSQFLPAPPNISFGEDFANTLAAGLHGVAKGMTLGQSVNLLKGVFGEETTKKRQEELKDYEGVKKASEFAGQMFPLTKGFKLVGAISYLKKLNPIARSIVTNAMVGGGMGAIEQKTKKESRLGKIIKEATTFGAIGGVAAGAAPLAKVVAKTEIPVLSKVAGWTVQKELPEGLRDRIRAMYGESAVKRAEAQGIGEKLSKFTPTEQKRATQLFKGGITTPATPKGLIEVVEKGKGAFEEATGTMQRVGALGTPYYQKLSEEQLGALKKKESWMNERLGILQETQKAVEDYPVKGKQGLFANYNKLLRWKEKYKGRLRELRSLEQWKDVDLDKNMAQMAVEGIDEELATVKNLIKTPNVQVLQGKITGLQGQVQKVTDRISTHYHMGGTGYFPRMYATKEEANNISKWGFFKPLRFKGKRTYLQPREDLPDEVRKNLGEIVTASYPVQKRLQQLSRDTALLNFFDDVSRNPAWSTTNAGEALTKGWTKLTKTPTWGLGSLRGSYLHPDVAFEINEITKVGSDFERVYNKILGWWKFGKVVPRPATSVRNEVSNIMFGDLGGIVYSDPLAWKVLNNVRKDYLSKGIVRQSMMKAGALGTEYLPTEVNTAINGLHESKGNVADIMVRGLRKGVEKAGAAFTAEDQIHKQWIYMYALEKGKTEKEALDLVFKWMPNYREVPQVTKSLRKSPLGAPFFSFTSEAMRIAGEAAREKPLKFAKWITLPLIINEIGKRKIGMNEEEYQSFKKQLPFYKRNGLHVILPIGSKDKPTMLDLTYTMFYNDAIEYSRDPTRVASNPLFTLAIEAITGKNRLTDKPITTHTKPSIFGVDGIQDWADHLYNNFMPTLAPEIPGTGIKGGYDYQRLKDLATGKPGRFTGEKPKVGQVLGSTLFGLKTETTSIKDLRKSYLLGKNKELNNLKSELARVLLDKSKTKEQKAKEKANILKKIKEVTSELNP